MNKASLRQALLKKRASIDIHTRSHAATQAAKIFQESHLFKENNKIACYLAQASEFDCAPMIEMIWQAGKQCYLPVLHNDHLVFKEYFRDTIMQLNRYGIPEPQQTSTIPIEQLEMVLMPLVGFDLNGNRLGMGGGYYDKTFAIVNKPLLMGVAYECQRIESLPVDHWDVPLNLVLTETGLWPF